MAARCYIRLMHPSEPILYVGYYGALESDWRKACDFLSLSTARATRVIVPKGYFRDVVLAEVLEEHPNA